MSSVRTIFAVVAAMFCSVAAMAGPVQIAVVGADGRPLSGAIVSVELPGVSAAARGSFTMTQRNISFDPRVLIVPVGASVAFPNEDRVRHHVYSFSRAKTFELKLYGRDTTKAVVFDKPGVAALGCNIHDAMTGFVYVTPSPFTAASNPAGRVGWAQVPAGRGTLTVWHPSIRAPGNMLSQPVQIGASGYQTTLTLRR
jgi:plastocyanin